MNNICSQCFISINDESEFCSSLCKERWLQEDSKVFKRTTNNIILDAIDKGIEAGYDKSYKHTNMPTEFLIKQHLKNSIMDELVNIIAWP